MNPKFLSFVGTVISLGFTLSTLPAQANSWSTGYYKQSDRSEVYYLNNDFFRIDMVGAPPQRPPELCHVQNPSQMEALGGFGQVQVVSSNGFKQGTVYIGECPWPNGFYRRASMPEVYGLNDRLMCWVSSPEMMEAYGGFTRVMVVEDASDLLAGRKDGGTCKWPR